MLGPLHEARFRRHFAHVDRGAWLALYSDGLIERRAPGGELFGLERLKAVLHANRELGAAALVERIFDELERFGRGGAGRDDETLVLVRRLGR